MSKAEDKARLDLMCAHVLSEAMRRQIKAELAGTMDEERFAITAVAAIKQNPDLADANPQSVYAAIRRAAHDGLLPDGREGVVTVYNRNVGTKERPRWERHAMWQPMVYGITKLFQKAGMWVDTQVVHKNDLFEQEFGDEPRIKHVPAKLGTDRGPMVGAYAIIRKDQHAYREVMDAEQIEAVRAQSKAPNSLGWATFTSEMWRKSPLRRLSKRVPLPERVRSAVESEDLDLAADEPVPTGPKLVEQIPDMPSTLAGALGEAVAKAFKPEPEPKGEVIQPEPVPTSGEDNVL
jgi:recombination protein RecT